MSAKARKTRSNPKGESVAQPPEEQEVLIEVFCNFTTGETVRCVVQVPNEAWFREVRPGDGMHCVVMQVFETTPREPRAPEAV